MKPRVSGNATAHDEAVGAEKLRGRQPITFKDRTGLLKDEVDSLK